MRRANGSRPARRKASWRAATMSVRRRFPDCDAAGCSKPRPPDGVRRVVRSWNSRAVTVWERARSRDCEDETHAPSIAFGMGISRLSRKAAVNGSRTYVRALLQ
jgi:hypothetical protein